MADKEQDDLYVRFKTLQRQLEFIEIQVFQLFLMRRPGNVACTSAGYKARVPELCHLAARFGVQEEYVKDETKNLKRELLRAQEEVKRIQSVPLVIGQFLEMIDANHGVVSSTAGSHYYVRVSAPASLGHDATALLVTCSARAILWRPADCRFRLWREQVLSTINRELLKPSSSVALHRHSNSVVDTLPPEADSSIQMMQAGEKPDVTYADIGGSDMQKQEIREAVELDRILEDERRQ